MWFTEWHFLRIGDNITKYITSLHNVNGLRKLAQDNWTSILIRLHYFLLHTFTFFLLFSIKIDLALINAWNCNIILQSISVSLCFTNQYLICNFSSDKYKEVSCCCPFFMPIILQLLWKKVILKVDLFFFVFLAKDNYVWM